MFESDVSSKIDLPVIYVLDRGWVRLIDHMGNDLSIVRAARVSYDAAWRTGEHEGSDTRLIDYLMRNHHTSPFETVQFTFEVMAPIFVLRQWHRHRTWKFNELSARYKELPQVFYVPKPEMIGVQSKDNKQARDIQQLTDEGLQYAQQSADIIWAACMESFKRYRELLQRGVPRELARGVLPVNTYSHMFATVDLHNLFHFLRLRFHSHAQTEIRAYADAILQLIEGIVPVAVKAFKQHILGESPSGNRGSAQAGNSQ